MDFSRLLSWLDATLASLGDGYIRGWTRVGRSYKRPAARLAIRLVSKSLPGRAGFKHAAATRVDAVKALPGEHLGQALNLDRPH